MATGTIVFELNEAMAKPSTTDEARQTNAFNSLTSSYDSNNIPTSNDNNTKIKEEELF